MHIFQKTTYKKLIQKKRTERTKLQQLLHHKAIRENSLKRKRNFTGRKYHTCKNTENYIKKYMFSTSQA